MLLFKMKFTIHHPQQHQHSRIITKLLHFAEQINLINSKNYIINAHYLYARISNITTINFVDNPIYVPTYVYVRTDHPNSQRYPIINKYIANFITQTTINSINTSLYL